MAILAKLQFTLYWMLDAFLLRKIFAMYIQCVVLMLGVITNLCTVLQLYYKYDAQCAFILLLRALERVGQGVQSRAASDL